MFFNVSLSGYGRATRGRDWGLPKLAGLNRIYYIHSGSVLHSTGTAKQILEPGYFYLFPQNIPFDLYPDNSTKVDHSFIDFFTTPLIKMDKILKIAPESNAYIKYASDITFYLVNTFPNIFSKPDVNPEHRELIKSYLSNLLTCLKEEGCISVTTNSVINQIIDYIHANSCANISVTELAKKYNFDVHVFIRIFKNATGVTPYQYIKRHKLYLAVTLLKSNKYKLSEIADIVGYADTASLSHAIKNTYNANPQKLIDN